MDIMLLVSNKPNKSIKEPKNQSTESIESATTKDDNEIFKKKQHLATSHIGKAS